MADRRQAGTGWLRRSGGRGVQSPIYDPAQEAGLIMRLRASDGVTLNATKVASWVDLVGAYDFANGTDALRPVFVSSWSNGQPAVDFNGSTHRLSHTFAADQLQGPGEGTTVYVVGELDTLTGSLDNTVIDFGNGRLWLLLEENSAADMGWFSATTYRAAGQASTGKHIWTWALDHDGVALTGAGYEDGVLLGTNVYSGTGLGGSTFLGSIDGASTAFLDGKIAEILVYNRLHDAATRARVEAYLAARYGL